MVSTGMHHAASAGSVSAMEYLKALGVSAAGLDQDLLSPLHVACQKGHLRAAEYLCYVPGVDVFAVTRDRATAMHFACESGLVELVRLLQARRLSVTIKDAEMRTPLHYACYYGRLEVVQYFVNGNFDALNLLLATNKRGNNCLHLAAQRGHLKLVKYIVSMGVNINCQNNTGHTSFHIASEKGHKDVVEWMSENGAVLWI
jgi:ankyrin repeat protein